jgi:P4 family phage/plasmid primase-like protien
VGNKGKDIKAIEIYSRGRYFTYTGNVVFGDIQKIPMIGTQTKWLMDTHIENKSESNSCLRVLSEYPMFNQLFSGQKITGKSDSELDFMFVSDICKVSLKEKVILELLQRSKLNRDKHGRRDYIVDTLNAASSVHDKQIIWDKDVKDDDKIIIKKENSLFFVKIDSELFKEFKTLKKIVYTQNKKVLMFRESIWEQISDSELLELFNGYIKEITEGFDNAEQVIRKWSLATKTALIISNIKHWEKFETHDGDYCLFKDGAAYDFNTHQIEPFIPDGVNITEKLGYKYHLPNQMPDWRNFIEDIMPDQKKREYLQRVMGYCFSKDISEQKFFVFIGNGANGKSLLVNSIADIMGNKASPISPDMLVSNHLQLSEREIVKLVGKHFVYTSEVSSGKINGALIRTLTGEDSVAYRKLYEEAETIRPYAKLILLCNQMPTFRDNTNATWRRLRVVRFNETFPPKEYRHPIKNASQFKRFLVLCESDIFNWLMEGYDKWKEYGLDDVPERFRLEEKDTRSGDDPIQEFLDDECIVNPSPEDKSVFTVTSLLYARYAEMVSPDKPLSKNYFAKCLIAKGFKRDQKRVHGITSRGFYNIKLIEKVFNLNDNED